MTKRYISDILYRRQRRTKTMMRNMKVWSETLADEWPEATPRGRGFHNWKTPVWSGLINPPRSSLHTQRRYIELILRAAAKMQSSKPEHLQHARVTAIISYPDLFRSSVDVFFDQDYWAAFAIRSDANDLWTALPTSRSLMKSYGLKVPAGFREQGYSTYWRDDDFDPPYENRQQVWIYSEVM